MKVIKNEKLICIDVDDTIVMHNYKAVPYALVTDPYSGKKMKLSVNKPNVRLLKEKKARGYTVIVWSQGGYAWAAAVVEALNLQAYVDLIMTKPTAYIDDKECQEWFGARIWIKPDVVYKE